MYIRANAQRPEARGVQCPAGKRDAAGTVDDESNFNTNDAKDVFDYYSMTR